MIAFSKERRASDVVPAWHARFMSLLPGIVAYARVAFRHLRAEARQEAVQAVVCNACCAVARLAELGKLELAYASPLARFGVAQVNAGRRTGGRLNRKDVLSRACRACKGIVVQRLDQYDVREDAWKEVLVPDRTCTPAALAASRLDFRCWLESLAPRDRKIATSLAAGERTGRLARDHGLSPGRVSQLRQELRASWQRFQGEPTSS